MQAGQLEPCYFDNHLLWSFLKVRSKGLLHELRIALLQKNFRVHLTQLNPYSKSTSELKKNNNTVSENIHFYINSCTEIKCIAFMVFQLPGKKRDLWLFYPYLYIHKIVYRILYIYNIHAYVYNKYLSIPNVAIF